MMIGKKLLKVLYHSVGYLQMVFGARRAHGVVRARTHVGVGRARARAARWRRRLGYEPAPFNIIYHVVISVVMKGVYFDVHLRLQHFL